jgi:hypothetical protein
MPVLLAALAALLGCAEQLQGPPAALEPTVTPDTVCNAGDMENAGLQTRVRVRPAAGSSFAPLPVRTLTPDAGLDLPRIALRREATATNYHPGDPPPRVEVLAALGYRFAS